MSSGSRPSARLVNPAMSANSTVTWRRSPSIADRALRTFSARCLGVYEAIEREGWLPGAGARAGRAGLARGGRRRGGLRRRQTVTAGAAKAGAGPHLGVAPGTARLERRAALVAEPIRGRIVGLTGRAQH